MKIEILNTDGSGCLGYKVLDLNKNKGIENHKRSFISHYRWEEDDIFELLGERKYKAFEGGKCQFDVTKSDIFRVSENINYFK